jgi:hypothetical protein
MKVFSRRAAEIEAAAFPPYTAKLEPDKRAHGFLNALRLPGKSLA